jgi:hypothetical protein
MITPTLFCPRCDRRLTPDHTCPSRRIFLASLSAAFFPFGTLPRGNVYLRFGEDCLQAITMKQDHTSFPRLLTYQLIRTWIEREARASDRTADGLFQILDIQTRAPKFAYGAYLVKSKFFPSPILFDLAKRIDVTPEMVFGKDPYVLSALR